MWLLDKITVVAMQVYRLLFAIIGEFLYKFIALAFQLFIRVSQVNILSSEQIQPLYQRVTMVLTIVMVFYVTLQFVKYVVQPEGITDKQTGVDKIVVRMITVVVLIAFVPRIFTLAYDFQNRVFKQGVIQKVILGSSNVDDEKYGYDFAAGMLSLFYTPDDRVCSQNASECQRAKGYVNQTLNDLKSGGRVFYMSGLQQTTEIVNSDNNTEEVFIVNYDAIFSIIVGGFIVYILIMYAIDVGARYAQLIYLQVIAPVAIISYIAPKKDGMFNKWVKQCTTTYLDLFIRVSIIYFVLLISSVIFEGLADGTILGGLGNANPLMKTLVTVVLILGLLMFAQKAPKMISELLPGGGSAGIGFGLGSKGRFKPTADTGKALASWYGNTRRNMAGVGNVRKAFRGALTKKDGKRPLLNKYGRREMFDKAGLAWKTATDKNAKGFYKGSVSERSKNVDAALEAYEQKNLDIKAAGGNPYETRYNSEEYKNKKAVIDRTLNAYKEPQKSMDDIGKYVDEFGSIKTLKKEWDAAKQRGDAAAAKTCENQYKAACQAVREQVAKNNGDMSKLANIQIKYEYKDAKTGDFVEMAEELIESSDNLHVADLNTVIQSKFNSAQRTKEIANLEAEIERIDSTGKKVKVNTAVKNMKVEEFAAFINKIKDEASHKVTEIEQSDEYKQIVENAKGAGGSGK